MAPQQVPQATTDGWREAPHALRQGVHEREVVGDGAVQLEQLASRGWHRGRLELRSQGLEMPVLEMHVQRHVEGLEGDLSVGRNSK